MFFKMQKSPKGQLVYIIDQATQLKQVNLSKEELGFAEQQLRNDRKLLELNRFETQLYIIVTTPQKESWQIAEHLRKQGAQLQDILYKLKSKEITITSLSATPLAAYYLAEGLALAAYQFLKYRSDAKKRSHTLTDIGFEKQSITLKDLKQLQAVTEAAYLVRNLVNEPLSYLTAEQLAKEITAIGKEGGFRVSVLGKAKIEQLNMGGLLAVNRGSILPPTFTVMEHRPVKAINKNPIVLVGKGVVYDTGGLSLKPTPNSMDRMKSDMSGGALVAGIMYVAARLDFPLHIIGLVPATENRPGENAYVPGDVITMYSGTTVEVLNTDAEGRMILADALHYAKKYQPELVLDFATLTGAASAAVGDAGIVCMGTATADTKDRLKDCGFRQYERLVEMPLWDEYGEMIKSDIADLKNIGGPQGGAMTAGKFLEHFTDYPWMHFDIAGVSHNTAKKDYRTTGGTAYGLRLIVDFLSGYGR
ncbi:leucyl aminopeptidase family protein [Taibaiella chishuiensis]|uniref:Leucyl aminopeptidase n=1 Tax=Taibaiella chishuiensis TaxID=1434707 RepID=A0A2P8CYK1_9BACT|nr:leucyl aminopeptidase family protein [Taibaiella chishuiensis]PSK90052.1 leucyl aminopeptidase [Taibaiella chishuiensis]